VSPGLDFIAISPGGGLRVVRGAVDSHIPRAFGHYREEGSWMYREAEEGRLPLPCLKGHPELSGAHPGLLGQAGLHSRHGRG
jgi:hypothetical protein